MLFLGIDVGSSSIKLAVVDGATGAVLASLSYPDDELGIDSVKSGWAEQDPEVWWECVKAGCSRLFASTDIDPVNIESIGIAYQMHGLVLVDRQQQVLRPSIIWCDSRAVDCGSGALEELGDEYCFSSLLNSPGNFTGAKLRWVRENEPELFSRIHKMMLPGDFIGMKLSGDITTTASGLSEGALWDFKTQSVAQKLLDHWELDADLIPTIVPSIGVQAVVSANAAKELGIRPGVKISYRAGDQPNNAMSLNVLSAGEVAATAGTSGVIYAVTDKPIADRQSRVNTFLHVNDSPEKPRNGILLCVNGTGRSYSWLRQLLGQANSSIDYSQLNHYADAVPVGSDGLIYHPFGNGAERLFGNRMLGAQLRNIDLNRHGLGHIARATQEGIVFALNKGFDVLKSLGGRCDVVRAAHANMFLSEVFSQAFANTAQVTLELFDTDGAQGAARAAAVGCGYYTTLDEAFANQQPVRVIDPDSKTVSQYQYAYGHWLDLLAEP